MNSRLSGHANDSLGTHLGKDAPRDEGRAAMWADGRARGEAEDERQRMAKR